jgi:hypothetical protein
MAVNFLNVSKSRLSISISTSVQSYRLTCAILFFNITNFQHNVAKVSHEIFQHIALFVIQCRSIR